MDPIVRRAIARWPNVPAVYGWLKLDRRGRWSVRTAGGDDESVMHRSAGVFQPIVNPQIAAFIGRNYERDARGRWYFQNGPQQVFVELDYLPYVYRLADDRASLVAHTGAPAGPIAAGWFDESGALVLDAALGPGVVLDRDLAAVLAALVTAGGTPVDDGALEAVAAGGAPLAVRLFGANFTIGAIASQAVPRRFGVCRVPAPA